MIIGPNRLLTHRRASLALEAPIARPWISLPERPLRDCSAFTPIYIGLAYTHLCLAELKRLRGGT